MFEAGEQLKAALAVAPGGPEVLRLTELATPAPGPGEILVDVALAAVNYADVIRRRGVTHRPGGFPLVPGIEAMGRIAAMGPDVAGLRAGQRVSVFPPLGGHASQVAVAAPLAVPLPDAIPDEQAGAFLVVGLTAYHMLTGAARCGPADTVLVTAAAGGVGSTAVQIAALLGCRRVLAAAGSAARAASALPLGATHAIDYSRADFRDQVMAATDGRGPDVVLDAVGDEVRATAFSCLAPFGRLVHYGNSSAAPEATPAEGALREAAIGSIGFSIRGLANRDVRFVRSGAETLLGWMAEGRLRFPVDAVLPLADAAEAHRRLEAREVTGKLLLRPPAGDG